MFGNLSVCKKFLAAGLCAVLLFAMSACQENPEGSIIVHKDMDNLISKAQEDDSSKVDAADIVDEVAENFETYVTTIENESLGVTVNVNAKVDVPQVDQLKVYRVKQKKFDQEFIDKVREKLMGDKAVYEADAVALNTREDHENAIKKCRDLIREAEERKAAGPASAGLDLSMEEWQEIRQKEIDGFQEDLNSMQEEYESSPLEIDLTQYPSDGKLVTEKERNAQYPEFYLSDLLQQYEEMETLNIVADHSDGNYQILQVQNSEYASNALFYSSSPEAYLDPYVSTSMPLEAWDSAQWYAGPGADSIPEKILVYYRGFSAEEVLVPMENETTTISEEEAISRAEEFLGELGISDFTFTEGGLFDETIVSYKKLLKDSDYRYHRAYYSIDTHYYRHHYVLRFRRTIDGILLSQVSGGKSDYKFDDPSYVSKGWPGEVIELRVNDSGIVGFAWQSPIEVTEVVAENTGMKPFAEIKDTFEKMVCVVNAPDDFSQILTADIDRVRLSYTRISDKDDFDTGLVVPVWGFEGIPSYDLKNGSFAGGPVVMPSKTFLTINAIDGSIIDGTLGY